MNFKPILRTYQYHEFKTAIDVAVEKHIKSQAAFPFQSCINCIHWKIDADVCGLYNAKPPAEIIVFSCPSYADDGEIPY